jgi:FixJ family two-component response regulator
MANRPISVAIVDDDAPVRFSLQRLCDVYGLSATAYASAKDFLTSLESGAARADCLLLDAQMPEMTGSELQRRLLERGVQIPTIVITADDAPVDAAAHAESGPVAWLQKPVSGDVLLAAIQQAVRGGDPTS